MFGQAFKSTLFSHDSNTYIMHASTNFSNVKISIIHTYTYIVCWIIVSGLYMPLTIREGV